MCNYCRKYHPNWQVCDAYIEKIARDSRTSLIKDDRKLYRAVDKLGVISDELKKLYPTLHFCYEWDLMLVDDGMPEFECCSCLKKPQATGE